MWAICSAHGHFAHCLLLLQENDHGYSGSMSLTCRMLMTSPGLRACDDDDPHAFIPVEIISLLHVRGMRALRPAEFCVRPHEPGDQPWLQPGQAGLPQDPYLIPRYSASVEGARPPWSDQGPCRGTPLVHPFLLYHVHLASLCMPACSHAYLPADTRIDGCRGSSSSKHIWRGSCSRQRMQHMQPQELRQPGVVLLLLPAVSEPCAACLPVCIWSSTH